MKPTYARPGTLDREHALELVQLSQRRLVEGQASARAWRVAATVWAQTLGYSRGWDTIYVEELGRLANIHDRRNTGRAIKECAALGAIEWEPSNVQRRPSLVGLPGAPREVAGVRSTPGDGRAGVESTPCAGVRSTPQQSNTSEVRRSKALPIEPENRRSGEPGSGTPQTGPVPLEHLTPEELQRGVREYGPTLSGLYAAELERRNVAPRRRPAWLDD
jgi:hypothetical protein